MAEKRAKKKNNDGRAEKRVKQKLSQVKEEVDLMCQDPFYYSDLLTKAKEVQARQNRLIVK